MGAVRGEKGWARGTGEKRNHGGSNVDELRWGGGGLWGEGAEERSEMEAEEGVTPGDSGRRAGERAGEAGRGGGQGRWAEG